MDSPMEQSFSSEKGMQLSSPLQLASTPVGATNNVKRKRSIREDDSRVNPFNRDIIDRLKRPIWSPSILAVSNSETPPIRTWAIEHIAKMNPCQFEDSPSTHQNEEVVTPETEARAQEAIKGFFSQENILPSPIHQSSPMSNRSLILLNSQEDASSTPTSPNSKSTNTDLSIPPYLPPDLQKLLSSLSSAYLDKSETMSSHNNSFILRRKLDFSFEESENSRSDVEIEETEFMSTGAVFMSPGADLGGEFNRRGFRNSEMASPETTPIRG